MNWFHVFYDEELKKVCLYQDAIDNIAAIVNYHQGIIYKQNKEISLMKTEIERLRECLLAEGCYDDLYPGKEEEVK